MRIDMFISREVGGERGPTSEEDKVDVYLMRRLCPCQN